MTATAALALNRSCLCVPVNVDVVYERLAGAGLDERARDLGASHPGLFAAQAVFVGREDAAAMQALVDAVESVAALPAYQAAALQEAPEVAANLPARPAVLHGFDFHITEAGPRLIEINTNAGGILLAVAAAAALQVQCPASGCAPDLGQDGVVDALWRMFLDVWQRARGAWPLNRIAIVDERPADQYLYPEFLLFEALFQRHGVAVSIVDPTELEFDGNGLRHDGRVIDLVYNRSTDFYLEGPALAALRQAALADAAVVTPDPRAHALYANKRNLAWLTDRALLERWEVSREVADILLGSIPHTEIVRPEAAERLWSARKRLFFKPARGFGSRGSYRGDKITRSRFDEVIAGDYVAQTLIPPGARVGSTDHSGGFRFDVRSYVYRGQTLMQTARVYQGQTTNFRTAGGGFAPVLEPASTEAIGPC